MEDKVKSQKAKGKIESKKSKVTARKAEKVEVKKTVITKVSKTGDVQSSVKLSADVLGFDGKKTGTVSLSSEVFGARVNPVLMAQAVRVYLANQRQGTADSKTRSEVAGTTKKVWQQKGTGRARHGSAKGPVFVGGGIVHGPHPRDYTLSLPQKARRAALASALTSQYQKEAVVFVDGQASGKTKEVASLLKTVGAIDKKTHKKVLLVVGEGADVARQAARNIDRVTVIPANCLNTYEVLNNKYVVFMKNAVDMLESTIFKKGASQ